MRQRNAEAGSVRATSAAPTRSAMRGIGYVALLLTLIASVLSGCVIVPVGYGYGYGHGGPYRHRGWDR